MSAFSSASVSSSACVSSSSSSSSAFVTPAKITVVVRKRPMKDDEISKNEVDVVRTKLPYCVLVDEPRFRVDTTPYTDTHKFYVDRAYGEKSNNSEVYETCVKPLVQLALKQNAKCSCFAYGQTGSGKTYTMLGAQPRSDSSERGILELAATDIFEYLDLEENKNKCVCVSFFEIYSGKLYDLLQQRKLVAALENGKKEVVVKDLRMEKVNDKNDLVDKMLEGIELRKIGANSINDESSRSHAILQIDFRNRNSKDRLGKIAFIDLAGSERGADSLMHSRQTQQDGAGINRSLLALKECIRAMDQDKGHIPFRDSELTKVLRDIFVGKSHSVMIANISPSISSCEQTLNTLRYAARVKSFRNNYSNNNSLSSCVNNASSSSSNHVPKLNNLFSLSYSGALDSPNSNSNDNNNTEDFTPQDTARRNSSTSCSPSTIMSPKDTSSSSGLSSTNKINSNGNNNNSLSSNKKLSSKALHSHSGTQSMAIIGNTRASFPTTLSTTLLSNTLHDAEQLPSSRLPNQKHNDNNNTINSTADTSNPAGSSSTALPSSIGSECNSTSVPSSPRKSKLENAKKSSTKIVAAKTMGVSSTKNFSANNKITAGGGTGGAPPAASDTIPSSTSNLCGKNGGGKAAAKAPPADSNKSKSAVSTKLMRPHTTGGTGVKKINSLKKKLVGTHTKKLKVNSGGENGGEGKGEKSGNNKQRPATTANVRSVLKSNSDEENENEPECATLTGNVGGVDGTANGCTVTVKIDKKKLKKKTMYVSDAYLYNEESTYSRDRPLRRAFHHTYAHTHIPAEGEREAAGDSHTHPQAARNSTTLQCLSTSPSASVLREKYEKRYHNFNPFGHLNANNTNNNNGRQRFIFHEVLVPQGKPPPPTCQQPQSSSAFSATSSSNSSAQASSLPGVSNMPAISLLMSSPLCSNNNTANRHLHCNRKYMNSNLNANSDMNVSDANQSINGGDTYVSHSNKTEISGESTSGGIQNIIKSRGGEAFCVNMAELTPYKLTSTPRPFQTKLASPSSSSKVFGRDVNHPSNIAFAYANIRPQNVESAGGLSPKGGLMGGGGGGGEIGVGGSSLIPDLSDNVKGVGGGNTGENPTGEGTTNKINESSMFFSPQSEIQLNENGVAEAAARCLEKVKKQNNQLSYAIKSALSPKKKNNNLHNINNSDNIKANDYIYNDNNNNSTCQETENTARRSKYCPSPPTPSSSSSSSCYQTKILNSPRASQELPHPKSLQNIHTNGDNYNSKIYSNNAHINNNIETYSNTNNNQTADNLSSASSPCFSSSSTALHGGAAYEIEAPKTPQLSTNNTNAYANNKYFSPPAKAAYRFSSTTSSNAPLPLSPSSLPSNVSTPRPLPASSVPPSSSCPSSTDSRMEAYNLGHSYSSTFSNIYSNGADNNTPYNHSYKSRTPCNTDSNNVNENRDSMVLSCFVDKETEGLMNVIMPPPNKQSNPSQIFNLLGVSTPLEEMDLNEIGRLQVKVYEARDLRLRNLLRSMADYANFQIQHPCSHLKQDEALCNLYSDCPTEDFSKYVRQRIQMDLVRLIKSRKLLLEAEELNALSQILVTEFQTKSAKQVEFNTLDRSDFDLQSSRNDEPLHNPNNYSRISSASANTSPVSPRNKSNSDSLKNLNSMCSKSASPETNKNAFTKQNDGSTQSALPSSPFASPTAGRSPRNYITYTATNNPNVYVQHTNLPSACNSPRRKENSNVS